MSEKLPKNTLAWCDKTEAACKNSIRNTAVGGYLSIALAIIRRQHGELQQARNDLIASVAVLLIAEERLKKGGGGE